MVPVVDIYEISFSFFFSGIVYISESFFFSNCTVLTFETILLYLILL
jgi:hypothetical protein